MKVFKFGGGILYSAEAVKKIPAIIGMFPGEPLIIVVSAFGKTTNAIEKLITSRFNGERQTREISGKIIDYHQEILQGLFPDPGHPVYAEIQVLWDELYEIILREPPASYSEFYDKIICYGELLSSKIVSHALISAGLENNWIDVRRILKTDSAFQEASVDWEASQANAGREI
ncbi:MAG: aspartate kinase, partial [Bacteroidales bacterium]